MENNLFQTYDKLPDILTINELCQYLKLGKVNTYKLVKQKGFTTIMIGNTIRVPKNGLIDWIQNNTRKAGNRND